MTTGAKRMHSTRRRHGATRSITGWLVWVACLAGCSGDSARPTDAGAALDVLVAPDLGADGDSGDSRDAALDARRGPRLNHDADCPMPAPPDTTDAGPSTDLLRPGRYGVGVRTVSVIDEARDRTLPLEVWYPIDPATTSGRANAYFFDTSLGTLAHMCSPARRDAEPASGGPFPLVLFSHGYGGIRFQSVFLTEHLASHGFVVAAPDHVGNTFADLGALGDDAAAAQSAIDRPLDMIAVLDAMLDRDAAGVSVPIDAARIAIAGHSFGGWTCFETARREPRIRVVVPLAPGFREPSSPAIAAELERPLMVFGGSADRTTPIAEGARPAYDAAAPPKALVTIVGAGHFDFSDICEVAEVRGVFDDGCDPAVLDPAVVRDRVRVLALAFLRRHLDGDTSFEVYLETSAVLALGDVEHERDP